MVRQSKTPRERGVFRIRNGRTLFLEADAGELLLEPRKPSAAVHQLLLPAGPGRVRFGVDVEVQRVPFLAPGGAGGEFGSVGHHHLDGVIVGMEVRFHGLVPARRARGSRKLVKSRGSITQAPAGDKRIQISHGDVTPRAPIRWAHSRRVERTALGPTRDRRRAAPIATRGPAGHCRATAASYRAKP